MGSLQGYEALQERLKRLGHMDGRLMTLLLVQAEREAKLRARRKTGNMSRSIGHEQTSDTSGRLYARANYAGYVERGTQPHVITPRVAAVLAWPGSGMARLTGSARVGASMVFAMRVHHPGTRPHPFIEPGAKAAIEGAGLANEVVAVWDGKP